MISMVRGTLCNRHLVKPLAAAALLAALAACADTGTAPSAATTAAPPRLFAKQQAAGPTLISNTVKYHDNSAPHATGRSGSAVLHGRATRSANGITRLLISTGDLDSSTAPGEIAKAQIKVFDADGKLLFVENHNKLSGGGRQLFLLTDVPYGARIQVQANVRGIDGNRTDVVTITDQVRAAPMLGVDLQLPSSARVGQPTVINAVVSELGGDLGTRADCLLFVDGRQVDQARQIWVDAGGTVTCAFTYTFATAGSHTVEARVVPPPGMDAVGDAGTLGVSADGNMDVGGGDAMGYTASVENKTTSSSESLDYTWWKPDGSHKEYAQVYATTHRTETMRIDGIISRPLQFPVSVRLTMASGGTTWVDHDWSGLASGVTPHGEVCADQQVADQGAIFWVCNSGLGATLGYTRFAGTVVYHSEGYSNTFDGPSASLNTYTWNDTWEEFDTGGAIRPLGSTVGFTVRITDAVGTLTVSPVVTLSPFSTGPVVTPRTCVTEELYWLDGGSQTSCTSSTTSETGVRGSTSG